MPEQSFEKTNYRVLTMKLEMLCSSAEIHLYSKTRKKNYEIHHLKFEKSRNIRTIQNQSTEIQKLKKNPNESTKQIKQHNHIKHKSLWIPKICT